MTSSSSEESDIENIEIDRNVSNPTPPAIVDAAKEMNENLLPCKSKDKYIAAYEKFISWRNEKQTNSFSENVLMAYFGELSPKYKPSSLWANYSMLKGTLQAKHCVNIEEYKKLTAYLKRQSDGYTCKKSKILSGDNVEKFIDEAPDDQYLATKAALILGITGALRRQELADLTVNDIEQQGDVLLVKIPNTKNKIPRSFVVHGKYYKIVKKYQDLRSAKGKSTRFFQQFRSGKCTAQVIGRNKIGSMPKEIVEYLKLPDAKSYTGHSFRRTSATLLADAGADIMTLKRHGGWKSSSVAEGYVEDSLNSKKKISAQITNSILKSCENIKPIATYIESEPIPSTSFSHTYTGHSASTSTTYLYPEPVASTSFAHIEAENHDAKMFRTFVSKPCVPPSKNIVPEPNKLKVTNNDTPANEELTANITHNLSQTITVPEKSLKLNFNHCSVTINFNK